MTCATRGFFVATPTKRRHQKKATTPRIRHQSPGRHQALAAYKGPNFAPPIPQSHTAPLRTAKGPHKGPHLTNPRARRHPPLFWPHERGAEPPLHTQGGPSSLGAGVYDTGACACALTRALRALGSFDTPRPRCCSRALRALGSFDTPRACVTTTPPLKGAKRGLRG